MEVTVLAVPECPMTGVLRERLAEVLAGRKDVQVSWREVSGESEALRLGMHGSPTLLVDGVDPFVREGEPASLSCRLYGPEHDAVTGVPSVERLRAALGERLAADVIGRGGRGRSAPAEGGQRAVQQAVLLAFATHGRPPTDDELAESAALSGRAPGDVLAELSAADYLRLDADGRICAAYPFSPVPTAHRVRIRGGPQVWAMCAVDALGIAPMLGRDVGIRSADPQNGREVTVTFSGGAAGWEPASAVVLVPTGACSGPAVDICCSSVNFFTDRGSALRWAAEHPEARGRIVAPGQAETLGREVFGPLLDGA